MTEKQMTLIERLKHIRSCYGVSGWSAEDDLCDATFWQELDQVIELLEEAQVLVNDTRDGRNVPYDAYSVWLSKLNEEQT